MIVNQEDYDEPGAPMEESVMRCTYCGGTGLAPEGWDCEECDGLGYWEE